MDLKPTNIHLFGENTWDVAVKWENAFGYQGITPDVIKGISDSQSTLKLETSINQNTSTLKAI
tara:strand:- start:136 stop:324 length:189 start_codon:yes stop_codon:yes gene_type:complete